MALNAQKTSHKRFRKQKTKFQKIEFSSQQAIFSKVVKLVFQESKNPDLVDYLAFLICYHDGQSNCVKICFSKVLKFNNKNATKIKIDVFFFILRFLALKIRTLASKNISSSAEAQQARSKIAWVNFATGHQNPRGCELSLKRNSLLPLCSPSHSD